LCMLLCRLAYPKRLTDIVGIFHRDQAAVSRILKAMIEWFHASWNRLYHWGPERLTPERLAMFTQAIAARIGAHARDDVFGFLDGTSIEICKPTYHEQCMFGSKGQKHYLRYNLVMLPDGIVAHISEPAAGT
ncbi:hypothetical protein F5H01DRAFT_259559, partial [Linnemannia elongata]